MPKPIYPKPLENFSELNYDVLNHDLRIFIQGAEVTNDILGSVSVRIEQSPGYNNASFDLDNAIDKYIITEENLPRGTHQLYAKFGTDKGKYSENAKAAIYNFKIKEGSKNTEFAPGVIQDTFFEMASKSETPESSFSTGADVLEAATSLAKSTVEQLDDSYFRDVGSSTISNEQADTLQFGIDDTNPNIKSAYNTMLSLANNIKNQFPNVSSEDAKRISKEAVKNRMKGESLGGWHRASNPFTPPPRILNPLDTYSKSYRWEFHVGDCIFTQLDPIVIFSTNPLASNEEDQWFRVFTGFLNECVEAKDYLTGESKIHIVAHDIRFIMKKMRVASNTITTVKQPELVYKDESFFTDLIEPDARTTNFSDLKFEDAVTYLLTGIPSLEKAMEQDVTSIFTGRTKQELKPLRGVGGLYVRRDGKVEYPDPDERNLGYIAGSATPPIAVERPKSFKILEDWHKLALLGPTRNWLTYGECTRIGLSTQTGNTVNDPMFRGVNFLLPVEGTAIRNIVEWSVIGANSSTYNFKDRENIFSNMLQTLNYICYVAPHGDIMIEFPFYEFIVEDFGYWKKCFTFDKHLLGMSLTYENPDVKTCVIVTGSVAPGAMQQIQNTVGQGTIIGANNTVVISSPKLVSRYGVNTDTISLPFIGGTDKLFAYGLFKLQQHLGNANAMSLETVFRPFLLPNRPVMNVQDKKMGVTESTENTWNVFGECRTTYGLKFIRTNTPVLYEDPVKKISTLQDTWVFLTGGSIMGTSYRLTAGIGAGNQKSGENDFTPLGEGISGMRIYPTPKDPNSVTNTPVAGTDPNFSSADTNQSLPENNTSSTREASQTAQRQTQTTK